MAQTPPPFVGLLTSATDVTTSSTWLTDIWYTTNGAGIPGNYFGPAYNGTKVDAIFGTTAYRPPPQTSFPTAGGCVTPNLQSLAIDYSKIIPQSRDGAHMLFPDTCGWNQIYTCTTSGTFSCSTNPVRIQIDSVTNSFAAEGTDFITDSADWWFANDPTKPDIIYYMGRKTNSSGRNELKAYHISTNTSTVVFDFTTILASFPGADSVDNFREGNATDDDRYSMWAFVNQTTGEQLGFGIFDMSTVSIIASKAVTAGGICGASSCNAAGGFTDKVANWVGACGLGSSGTNYFIMNMNNVASRPWTVTRGTGTWVFDINLNVLGIADYQNGHADCGLDKSGNRVYITNAFEQTHFDSASVAVVNLAMISATPPATNNPQWAGELENGLPCLWQFNDTICTTDRGNNGGYTISMRGSHGTQQGTMMLAAFCQSGGASLTCNGGWGALEIDAVIVDWNSGTVPGLGTAVPFTTWYRVGRCHAINSEYFTQCDAVPNWDSTRIFFTSSGDINNGPSPAQMASNMLPTAQQVYHMPLIINLASATSNGLNSVKSGKVTAGGKLVMQ